MGVKKDLKIINYRIEFIDILLREECILKRYYPLIPYKRQVIESLLKMGCMTKDECAILSDEKLMEAGLPNTDYVNLFRAFLSMYDYRGKGIKDIMRSEDYCKEELDSLLELMLLPGVKEVRAKLYYSSGFKSINDFANSNVDTILNVVAETIESKKLSQKCPFPKEVRTQLAVARAFTGNFDSYEIANRQKT